MFATTLEGMDKIHNFHKEQNLKQIIRWEYWNEKLQDSPCFSEELVRSFVRGERLTAYREFIKANKIEIFPIYEIIQDALWR